jgi:hypothetical protein
MDRWRFLGPSVWLLPHGGCLGQSRFSPCRHTAVCRLDSTRRSTCHSWRQAVHVA